MSPYIFRCCSWKLPTLVHQMIRICWCQGLCFRNAVSQVTLHHGMEATNDLRGTSTKSYKVGLGLRRPTHIQTVRWILRNRLISRIISADNAASKMSEGRQQGGRGCPSDRSHGLYCGGFISDAFFFFQFPQKV